MQNIGVSELRCTEHIPQSVPLNGRFRCIPAVGKEFLTGSYGSVAAAQAFDGERQLWPRSSRTHCRPSDDAKLKTVLGENEIRTGSLRQVSPFRSIVMGDQFGVISESVTLCR